MTALSELQDGQADGETLKGVLRDLHTLKGESRMVGEKGIGKVAHAAEELLLADEAEESSDSELLESIGGAVRVIRRALQGELQNPERALAEAAEALERYGKEGAPARAEPEGEPDEPPAAEGGAGAERWMQVKATRVDGLCERVFELATLFRGLQEEVRGLLESGHEGSARESRVLFQDFDRCSSMVEEVVGEAWSLRLVPVEPGLEDLAGHARELARGQKKKVRATAEAAGAEIERHIFDLLWEPLVHLVRNSVDHGIEEPEARRQVGKPEEARLRLTAEPSGPHVIISIEDDGAGIDRERVLEAAIARGIVSRKKAELFSERETLELLFGHGFSTRKEAGEVSGRGVGLDVVRDVVEQVGGAVDLETAPGRGTRISLSVPATISREREFVIECGDVLYGIPSRHILKAARLRGEEVRQVAGGRVLSHDGETLPLRSLSASLGSPGPEEFQPWVLILEFGGRRWAVTAPSILAEFEVLRRPVDPLLSSMSCVGASSSLDDGRLVLCISIAELVRRLDYGGAAAEISAREARTSRVLVVDDSPIIREVVAELLVEAGLEVKVAENGKAGLDAFEEEPPDAVITDLEMPIMDGFELLSQIRSLSQEVPIIVLTTRGSGEDRRRAVTLGADAYLVKSDFEDATLVMTVERFLRDSA